MPIPEILPGEKEQDFIKRCVIDPSVSNEFPDITQRLAVCYSKIEDSKNLNVLNSNKEQVIKVFSFGRLWIDKYNEWLEFNKDFALKIIENFNNPNIIKPIIDREHDYEESYGDIKELFIKEDGLYAKIELNNLGIDLVKNKIYKSISPSIGNYADVNGKEYYPVLLAISLVNYPALGNTIPSLQEQLSLKHELKNKKNIKLKEDKMEVFKKLGRILELKLRDDITEQEVDNIINKVSDIKNMVESLQIENEDLKNKINELQSEIIRLKIIEEEVTEKEATDAVKKEVEAGIIPGSLFELYKKRYKENKKEFQLEIETRKKFQNEKIKTELKSLNLSDELIEDIELKNAMVRAGIDVTNEQSVKNFIEFYKNKKQK